jgi:hypothetical protein
MDARRTSDGCETTGLSEADIDSEQVRIDLIHGEHGDIARYVIAADLADALGSRVLSS